MLSSTALSTNMDLCHLGLETPYQILQASGHTVHVRWETIFEVLGSICQATPSNPASYLIPPKSSMSYGQPPLLRYLQEKVLIHLMQFSLWCCWPLEI